MTTDTCLSKEARNRIDAHLDLMDEKLRSGGLSRSERQGILDDLQTQITEMAMARKGRGSYRGCGRGYCRDGSTRAFRRGGPCR